MTSLYDGWDAPRPGWRCPECGLDYDATSPAQVAGPLRSLVARFGSRLGDAWKGPGPDPIRIRPDPATWSALEYACHVRDCLALYHWRIRKVLDEDTPTLPQMRRDAVVTEQAYNEQDPAAVASEMAERCGRLEGLLNGLGGADWDRFGIRDGERLSVSWMAVNVLHEARHHLGDFDEVRRRVGPG